MVYIFIKGVGTSGGTCSETVETAENKSPYNINRKAGSPGTNENPRQHAC